MPTEIRSPLLGEAGINWQGPPANFLGWQKCSGPWHAWVKTEHLRSEHCTVCRLKEEEKSPQLKSLDFLHLNAQGILGARTTDQQGGPRSSWLSTWASGSKLCFSYFLLAKPTKHYLLCLPLWLLGPPAAGQGYVLASRRALRSPGPVIPTAWLIFLPAPALPPPFLKNPFRELECGFASQLSPLLFIFL